MTGGLMPIGAFARLCRLTVKAVRHYDAEGLLVPAVVDPQSGYRYYRADQVPTATTIAVLRGLDVPPPVVREVLGAATVLAGQRERWATELARREEVLRSLDGLLSRPERVRYDVVVADREPSWLRGVTGTVRATALDDDTGALCRRALAEGVGREPLLEHVRERGHTATGPETETYLADPGTTPPSELVTRLAVALFP